ncbi:MAG: hypothetical protein ACOYB7_02515 [Mycobacterium sp.]
MLDRVEAGKPIKPDPAAIRTAIREGAGPEVINNLLLADLGAGRLNIEWAQARTDAAGAVLAAILGAADKILPALTELAEACIEKLVAVAALDGARLEDLVKAGRTTDAELLANVDVVAAELNGHYDFRDRYLTRGGVQSLAIGGWNASRWRDPVAAQHHVKGSTPTDVYLSGLRSSVPLWYPTPAEAIEVARAVADDYAAEQARIMAANHGVGSIAI